MYPNWFQRFSLWLSRFLYGRRGGDQLSAALFVLYCVLLLLSGIPGLRLLYLLSLLALVYALFRMLSRNWYARQRENDWFLRWWRPVSGWFRSLFRRVRSGWGRMSMRLRDRKICRYYRCPKCGNTLRVPRGKGKIVVTCPVCRHEFVRKT